MTADCVAAADMQFSEAHPFCAANALGIYDHFNHTDDVLHLANWFILKFELRSEAHLMAKAPRRAIPISTPLQAWP